MTSTTEQSPSANTQAEDVPALRVEGLQAGYDRTVVLRGVDLTVPQGNVVALVGPNGAGKTTLMKTVAGLVPPTGGTVSMFGENVTKLAAASRASNYLCSVPEGRGIYRSLTVRENLRLQARKGHEREAIERAAQAFPRLGERLHQVAGTLSGGEQQMLSLASCYVRDPRLVLIDEASLGLAPVVVDVVFEFISKVAREGSAMLIVDQFVNRVLEIANVVYVLSRGSIQFEGSPSEFAAGGALERYLGTGQGDD